MGWRDARGKYTLKLSSAVKPREFGCKSWLKKLMQAGLAAFKSLSCSAQVQLLRQGSPEGSKHGGQTEQSPCQRSEPVPDPHKASASPGTACQIVPMLRELGRAGLVLQDQSSLGLSQQYPSNTSTPHMRLQHTHPPCSCPRGAGRAKYSPSHPA